MTASSAPVAMTAAASSVVWMALVCVWPCSAVQGFDTARNGPEGRILADIDKLCGGAGEAVSAAQMGDLQTTILRNLPLAQREETQRRLLQCVARGGKDVLSREGIVRMIQTMSALRQNTPEATILN